jgi:succinate dehydrogenase/fumarate reductase flavoprotein subunit
MASQSYDLIVVGSGFAGCMTTLNFLETCKRLNKRGRVALLEVGKKGERCGASRWTGAFLRIGQDLTFDEDWIQEMIQVSNGQADLEYCRKLAREAKATVEYVENRGVNFVRHEEKNVSDQHLFPISLTY